MALQSRVSQWLATIDVRSIAAVQKAALAEHKSQIPHDAPMFRLTVGHFDDVYDYEWFLRRGPQAAIDGLPAAM